MSQQPPFFRGTPAGTYPFQRILIRSCFGRYKRNNMYECIQEVTTSPSHYQRAFQSPHFVVVAVGNALNKQVVGIPVGTSSLFLYCRESQFIGKVKILQNMICCINNNTFRYLDNILAVNNANLKKYVRDIFSK